VVGQNPSRRGGNAKSIKTLYKWLARLELPVVSFINMHEGYKVDASNSQAAYIKQISSRYSKIIALGRVASDGLRGVAVDHFMLPHPSGLNRQLNDPSFVDERLASCKNYVQS
jgi:hypothetical protein